MSGQYEKQMKWKEVMQKKAAQVKAELEQQAEQPKFQPHFATAQGHLRDFEGPARALANRSGRLHVERQIKGRREKELLQSKIGPKPYGPNSVPQSSGDPARFLRHFDFEEHALRDRDQMGGGDDDDMYSEDQHQQQQQQSIHFNPRSPQQHQQHAPQTQSLFDFTGNENIPYYEEPIVEMLERERREWHEERMKLLHCIHMQQMEMSQRSIAAHDRAVDIAKEFARAIEHFESRLVSMENSVSREITAIKSISESLRASVAALQSQINR